MIIELGKLQDVSQKILSAVDTNDISLLTETLELKAENTTLYMSVTNKEYFVKVKVELSTPETFHATVNAKVFLKLVAQLTSDKVELDLDSTNMVVKGNGVYKLPLIFENGSLLELPEIVINNKVKEFSFSGNILTSILDYNSKEWLRGIITRPIQKLCYVDEMGALTFTSGACVNSFNLPEPVKLLFNQKLVRLFKLFSNAEVKMVVGYDALSDDITQTKVSLSTGDVVLVAILSCDDTMLNSVPVDAIRGRANEQYTYSIKIDRVEFTRTLNRLLLFSSMKNTAKPYGAFSFRSNGVTVWDIDKENHEDVLYDDVALEGGEYVATLNIEELKAILDNCDDTQITLSFGNHQAFVISHGNIKNILPEIILS